MKQRIIFQDPLFFSRNTNAVHLQYRRGLMSLALASSDVLAISASILTSITLWKRIRADLQLDAHLSFIPIMVTFLILTYQLIQLYPGVGIGPVEELKRLTISSTFLFIAMIAMIFFLQTTATYSRATLLISWILILVSVPISRKIFRRLALKLGIWGIPVAIAGESEGVTRIQKRLSLHPLTGLWPVLCIDGLPTEGRESLPLSQINTLILVTDQENFETIHHLVTDKAYRFKRIILILDEK